MMRGWKTWTAAVGLYLLAGLDAWDGRVEEAFEKMVYAFALVGIGHKLDRAGYAPFRR